MNFQNFKPMIIVENKLKKLKPLFKFFAKRRHIYTFFVSSIIRKETNAIKR